MLDSTAQAIIRPDAPVEDRWNPPAAPPGFVLHRRIVNHGGTRYEPAVPLSAMRQVLLWHPKSRTWVPAMSARGMIDEFGAWATPEPRPDHAAVEP